MYTAGCISLVNPELPLSLKWQYHEKVSCNSRSQERTAKHFPRLHQTVAVLLTFWFSHVQYVLKKTVFTIYSYSILNVDKTAVNLHDLLWHCPFIGIYMHVQIKITSLVFFNHLVKVWFPLVNEVIPWIFKNMWCEIKILKTIRSNSFAPYGKSVTTALAMSHCGNNFTL